jgi:hypothetical protein
MRGRIRFRYVPTAVAIPAPPLDRWRHRIGGLSPREIFDQIVMPVLRTGWAS